MNRSAPPAQRLLKVRFDALELEGLLARLAGRDAAAPFAYVVTPNVDHVLRLQDAGPGLHAAYERALFSVCDSRILRRLAAWKGMRLDLAAGSDLVAALFGRVVGPDTAVTMIGGTEEVAQGLRERYGLRRLAHHNPPQGFIEDASELARCVEFVVAHPARFVLLCVGFPRQEIVAARLAETAGATGLGLCVGAAAEFLTGVKRRAPGWMQRAHLEWLHRLLSEPRRLWRRYLLEAPRIFLLFWRLPRQGRAGSLP
jgi:exopolysaccharide biosynthesis WecB/TagA/CpsF family protein